MSRLKHISLSLHILLAKCQRLTMQTATNLPCRLVPNTSIPGSSDCHALTLVSPDNWIGQSARSVARCGEATNWLLEDDISPRGSQILGAIARQNCVVHSLSAKGDAESLAERRKDYIVRPCPSEHVRSQPSLHTNLPKRIQVLDVSMYGSEHLRDVQSSAGSIHTMSCDQSLRLPSVDVPLPDIPPLAAGMHAAQPATVVLWPPLPFGLQQEAHLMQASSPMHTAKQVHKPESDRKKSRSSKRAIRYVRKQKHGDGGTLTEPLSIATATSTVAVRDIGAFVNRPSAQRIKEAESKGHIVRPLNVFMLYRSAYAERAKEWAQRTNHQQVSVVAGQSWELETACIRNQFLEWAKVEKRNHDLAFPQYKYQPRNRQIYEPAKSEATTEAPAQAAIDSIEIPQTHVVPRAVNNLKNETFSSASPYSSDTYLSDSPYDSSGPAYFPGEYPTTLQWLDSPTPVPTAGEAVADFAPTFEMAYQMPMIAGTASDWPNMSCNVNDSHADIYTTTAAMLDRSWAEIHENQRTWESMLAGNMSGLGSNVNEE